MPLESTVSDIVSKLRQGRFPNEQAISQGIVLRLLQDLGWDLWDNTAVWPEYQTGEGRADFALCHPASKPAMFIEVKQPGKAEDAVRQALEYAFHTGVPFIVLTDGKTWGFYLPAERGSYDDRRVYKLDLFERTPDECAEVLARYLGRDRVASGQAFGDAQREYQSHTRRALARETLADAWRELLRSGDETLVDLLSTAVESKAGVRPEEEDVSLFLASAAGTPPVRPTAPRPPASSARPALPAVLGPRVAIPTPAAPTPQTPVFATPHEDAAERTSRRGSLVLQGRRVPYANATEAMVIILSELAKQDTTFLDRCHAHPENTGRKRRYIARTPQELFPDRPEFHDLHELLPGGWLVSTNVSNASKHRILAYACEVAGLRFGTDVTVEF